VPAIPTGGHTRLDPQGWMVESVPGAVRAQRRGARRVRCRGQLTELADGDQATATIRQIADGPAVESFVVTLSEVQRGGVDHEALLGLVAEVPLGNNPSWVNIRLEEPANSRRFLVLKP